ncbi:YqaJ viral recombinase family protein [Streptomyces sp. G1]|uniref:YqaJ viral recombinase family nuclease n=1 Tax=Streptomyces sp. G1 TaxID=361572 RepID=UPI00202E2A11|nr:YqaJ viral recombinase family protein [Streptomyces sp. G1]MCM1977189.1 YqaJ viral recombinase family protein [Streptomyces sp. G1]
MTLPAPDAIPTTHPESTSPAGRRSASGSKAGEEHTPCDGSEDSACSGWGHTTRPASTLPAADLTGEAGAKASEEKSRAACAPQTSPAPDGPQTAETAPCRLLLPHGAPRDEWLAARRPGITASEIAAVLGISPWQSAFSLYWEKTGLVAPAPDSDRLSLGRHLEPWIAERWAADHPDVEMVPGGLFASVERPWQLATPDRLLDIKADDRWRDGVLEIKSSGTYEGWGPDGSDEVPAYYRAQVLWQMDVLGLDDAFIVCFFLTTQARRTYRIPYDAPDVAFMRERALAFLDRVRREEPPQVDGHHATLTTLKALHPSVVDEDAVIPADVAARYRAACAAAKKADAAKAAAENQVRAHLASARVALDPEGRPVATRSVYDRRGFWVEPTTIDRLNPSHLKD